MSNVLVFKLKNNSLEETNKLFNAKLLNDIKTLLARSIFLPLFDKYTFNKNVDLSILYDDIVKSDKKHLILNISYVKYKDEWYGYVQVENSRIKEIFSKMNEIQLIGEHTFVYNIIFTEIQRNYFQFNNKLIPNLELLNEPLNFDEFIDILKKEDIKENKSLKLKALTRFFINKEIKDAKPHVNKFSLAMEFLSEYENFTEIDFINNYPDTYKDFELYYDDFLYISIN